MGNTYKDKNGYPRWRDSRKLVHRSVASNMIGSPIGRGRVALARAKMGTRAISERAI